MNFKPKTTAPEPKSTRPQTLKEARELIGATFKAQGEHGWDKGDREFYLSGFGIGNTVENLSVDKARIVIADLEKVNQILFEI